MNGLGDTRRYKYVFRKVRSEIDIAVLYKTF